MRDFTFCANTFLEGSNQSEIRNEIGCYRVPQPPLRAPRLVREQTRSVMTEEPSSFMMLLSDRRPNAEAMSAHDKGRVPRLEPRTMSKVDDESGGGHALVCTAGSKHVVPRALFRPQRD